MKTLQSASGIWTSLTWLNLDKVVWFKGQANLLLLLICRKKILLASKVVKNDSIKNIHPPLV